MLTPNNTFIISRIIKLRAWSFFKVLFAFLFINATFSLDVLAQRDVIITQAKEEIRCRILDETPTRFIYAYVGPKGDILRNEIFKNLVSDFRYNKYDSDLPLATSKKGKSKKNKKSKDIGFATNDVASSDSHSKETVKNKKDKEEKAVSESKALEQPVKSKKELRKEQKANKEKDEVASKDKADQEVLAEIKTSQEPEKSKKELRKEQKANEDKAKVEKANEDEIVLETSKKPVTEIKQPVDKELTKESKEKPVAKNIDEKSTLKPEKSMVEVPKKSTPVVGGTSVETTGEFENYLKWRIGVKAGIGNILDNNFEASNAYGLYQERLLKGWTFGADLAFFPLEGFGLGLVYTDFKSSNSSDNLTYINQVSGEEITGSISNKVSRKFLGPAFFLRKGIDFKTFVVLGVSPGMYFYSDKGDYSQANFEYTGREFGGAATLGLDFLLGNDIIGRDIILSLEAGYNMGKINDLNYGDGTGAVTLANPIIMDRLDFSIGLRFMRFPKYLKK
ncbi:cell envelope integrity protein TolA [Arcticibacterium luteifluviistationis]|uniref:Outer membrane protein beta-barrel domain-containing protein n=1 Tax=Arcticibacterium luteifluviistationis TaxID=1784714 RepID=A0A2Z4G9I6_9BACT|nr:hypothetical protein [Arcticibacterium luteifluviistationis]AWV97846.1 hypothetical protein DJ013_06560 [Arcticibacterium luteifluviistationis]